MTNRTCNQCDRPHYARGLCVTHYRAHRRAAGIDAKRSRYARRHTCECCGESYIADRPEQRYCDRTCRDITNYLAGQQAAASAHGVAARDTAVTCAVEVRACLHCEALFIAHPGIGAPRMYCKPSHRAAYSVHRKDAHRRHAPLVHARDGWTCWLCGEPTAREWTATDPLAPTLDHLIPRSLGGSDDPDNLGTAHAICNSTRGARLITTLKSASVLL